MEKIKSENDVLKNKLANAEEELLKNVEKTKQSEYKLKLEISALKIGKKEINDKMLEIKKEVIREEKKAKSHEKTILRLETNNSNLIDQIANFKADENNNKNKNEKLEKELKTLWRKNSKAKELKSTSIQTEQDILLPESLDTAQHVSESSENNSRLGCSNMPPETPAIPTPFLSHSRGSPWTSTPPLTFTTSCLKPSTSAASSSPSRTPPRTPPQYSTAMTKSSIECSSSAQKSSTPSAVTSGHQPTLGISADYIMGINDINLGPRINDLSKM